MTETTTVETTVETATAVVETKTRKPSARKGTFTFGTAWMEAVRSAPEKYLEKHSAKLLEHAVFLKAGARSDLKKLKLATLRSKVVSKIAAPAQTETAAPAATAE